MFYMLRTTKPQLSSRAKCDELQEKVMEQLEVSRVDVKLEFY
jgi:hypothetical protein